MSRLDVAFPLETLEQKIEAYAQAFRHSQNLLKLVSQHKHYLDKNSLNQLEQLAISLEEASYVLSRFPEYLAPVIELEQYRKIDAVEDEDVHEFIEAYNKASAEVLISFQPGEALFQSLAFLQEIDESLRTNKDPVLEKQLQSYEAKERLIQLLYQTASEEFPQTSTLEARVNRWSEQNPSLSERAAFRKQKHKIEKEGDLLVCAYDDLEDAYAELHRYDSLKSVVNAAVDQQSLRDKEGYAQGELFLKERLSKYKKAKDAFESLNQQPKEPNFKTAQASLTKSVAYLNFLLKHPPSGLEKNTDMGEFLKQTYAAKAALEKSTSLFKNNRSPEALKELIRIQKEATQLISLTEHKYEQILSADASSVRKNLLHALHSLESNLYLSSKGQEAFLQKHTQLSQKLAYMNASYAPDYQKMHKALKQLSIEVDAFNKEIQAEKQATAFNQAALLASQVQQSLTLLNASFPITKNNTSLYARRIQSISQKIPDKKMSIPELSNLIAQLKQCGLEINEYHTTLTNPAMVSFLQLVQKNAAKNKLSPEDHALFKEDSIAAALKMAYLNFGAEAVVQLLEQVDFSLLNNKTLDNLLQFMEESPIKASDYFVLYGAKEVAQLKSNITFAKIINEVESTELIKRGDSLWNYTVKLLYDGFLINAESAVLLAQDKANQDIVIAISEFCGLRACSAISEDELQAIFQDPLKSSAVGMLFDDALLGILDSYNKDEQWQGTVLVNLIQTIANNDGFAAAMVINNSDDAFSPEEKVQMLHLQLLTSISITKDPQAPVAGFLQKVLEDPDATYKAHKKILSIYCGHIDTLKEHELAALKESAQTLEKARALSLNPTKEAALTKQWDTINKLIIAQEKNSLLEERALIFAKLAPLESYKGDINKLAATFSSVDTLFDEAINRSNYREEVLLLEKTKMRVLEVFLKNSDWQDAMKQSINILDKAFPNTNGVYQKVVGAFIDLKKSFTKLVNKSGDRELLAASSGESAGVDYYRNLGKKFKKNLEILNKASEPSAPSELAESMDMESVRSKIKH